MSLTLDPTLAARMNEQTRHPLIEIKSIESVASIPFDGTEADAGELNESSQSSILLSTGRICHICYLGIAATSPYYHLRYRYSDVDKTTFTVVDFVVNEAVADVSLTELANGNIGIVFRGSSNMFRMVITVEGAVVSAAAYAFQGETLTNAHGPYVITLSDDSYLMIYSNISAGSYSFYKRTSSDFLTWSAASALSISGLTAANVIANPFILQVSGSTDLWLFFDYAESVNEYGTALTNIYYSMSTDSGASWGAAVKFTDYTQYNAVGKHPVAVQKTATSMHVIYDEFFTCLHMNPSTEDWPDLDYSMNIHFDAVGRKLYAAVGGDSTTDSQVVVVDVDNWVVLKVYNAASEPALPSGRHVNPSYPKKEMGGGQYFPISGYPYPMLEGYDSISVICGEDDAVINIYPHPSDPDYNVTGISGTLFSTWNFIYAMQVDATTNRLWVLFRMSTALAYTSIWVVGYFSLTETGGSHTFVQVMTDTYAGGYPWGDGFTLSMPEMKVYAADDLIILYFPSNNGAMKLYNITTGALWKEFRNIPSNTQYTNNPTYPEHGLYIPCLLDGIIWGVGVHTAYDTEAYLYRIDLANDVTTKFLIGSFSSATPESYSLVALDSDRLLMCANWLGIGIFTISTMSWQVFDNSNVPGIFDVGTALVTAEFDATANMIYTASNGTGAGTDQGITAFSILGSLKQSQYVLGNYAAGWTWGTKDNLAAGHADYEASVINDPIDNVLYAFWTRQASTDYRSIWDKEGIALDLAKFLIREKDITMTRAIDGTPSRLSFSVSHGHLFDVHNKNSLMAVYLKKGRRLTLRLGETISGTNYYQNQGTFIITAQKMTYQRGTYPEMEITAEDKSKDWGDMEVVATTLYTDQYPEDIISDILDDHANIAVEDIVIADFDTRVKLTHQWVESDVQTIIADILNRFGYYIRVNVDDQIEARKISAANAVDNDYANLTKIIDFTPNDDYSSNINRVIVVGTEKDKIEVLYPEERVATLSGQVTYNTGTEEHYVYYSDDISRKCREPRLVVNKSTTSIGFKLAGEIEESLIDNSLTNPNENLQEKYCIVEIDAPDLTNELIAAMAGLVASYLVPDTVLTFVFAGVTIRVGSYLTAFMTWTVLQILSATGTYDYEIWAKPVGEVNRTIQGQADDLANQALIGHITTKKIDDPLCTTLSECQQVAAQELMVATAQRSRVSFEMMYDLRNEDGDTIQIRHPYSLMPIKVFITNLERKISKDGVFDSIDGWVL